MQHASRDQASLNIAPDCKPGKKIWVLKDKAAFGAWAGDRLVADEQFARIRDFQAGHEAKQG